MVAVAGLWLAAITDSLVGLIAIPLILFMAMDLGVPAAGAASHDLVARRALGASKALVDEAVLVQLTLLNRGGAIRRLEVEDQIPSGAELTKGSPRLACAIGKGGKATLRYEVTFRQPAEPRFGEIRAVISSPFGLREQGLTLTAPAALRVYPRLVSRRMTTGRAKAFTWIGSSPSRLRGGHVEFANIRSYVAGDPLRDVNWKATARLGKEMTNEWYLERGLDCVVVVNLSADTLPAVGEWSARGEVIACAYELASSLITYGNRVGMLILGFDISRVRPGFGKRQLRIMLDELVSSSPGEVWKVQHVDDFLETFFRAQYRSRGGTLFFVSPGASMSFLATVRSLSGRKFSCTCVYADTFEMERAALGRSGVLDEGTAERGARYAREELDWYERQFGGFAQVYEWNRSSGFQRIRAWALR